MKKKPQAIEQKAKPPLREPDDVFGNCNPYQTDNVYMEGLNQMRENNKIKKTSLSPEDAAYKLLTLYEFKNSILITQNCSEQFKSLMSDLSMRFQKEFNCQSVSERSLAHLTAQNYIRTLELQRQIYLELSRSSYSDMSTRRLAILEKAYDRANQQYILTLQALKTSKMPPMSFKLVAQNAMFGQNQQVVNEAESKEVVSQEINNAK